MKRGAAETFLQYPLQFYRALHRPLNSYKEVLFAQAYSSGLKLSPSHKVDGMTYL